MKTHKLLSVIHLNDIMKDLVKKPNNHAKSMQQYEFLILCLHQGNFQPLKVFYELFKRCILFKCGFIEIKLKLRLCFRRTCLTLTSILRAGMDKRQRCFDKNKTNLFIKGFLQAFISNEMDFKCNHIAIDLLNELEIASGGRTGSVIPQLLEEYSQQKASYTQVFLFQYKLYNFIKDDQNVLGCESIDSDFVSQLAILVKQLIKSPQRICLLYSCTELQRFVMKKNDPHDQILNKLKNICKTLGETILDVTEEEDFTFACLAMENFLTLRPDQNLIWYKNIISTYNNNNQKFQKSTAGITLVLKAFQDQASSSNFVQYDLDHLIEDLLLSMQFSLHNKVLLNFDNDFTCLSNFLIIQQEYPTLEQFIESLDIKTLESLLNNILEKISKIQRANSNNESRIYFLSYLLNILLFHSASDDYLINIMQFIFPSTYNTDSLLRFSFYNVILRVIIRRDLLFLIQFWTLLKQQFIDALLIEQNPALKFCIAMLMTTTIILEKCDVFTEIEQKQMLKYFKDLDLGECGLQKEILLRLVLFQANEKVNADISIHAQNATIYLLAILNQSNNEHRLSLASGAVLQLSSLYKYVNDKLKQDIENFLIQLVNYIKYKRQNCLVLKFYLYPLCRLFSQGILQRNPLFTNKQTKFLLISLLIYEQNYEKYTCDIIFQHELQLGKELSGQSLQQLQILEIKDSTFGIWELISNALKEDKKMNPKAFSRHQLLFDIVVFTMITKYQIQKLTFIIDKKHHKNPFLSRDIAIEIYSNATQQQKQIYLSYFMQQLHKNKKNWDLSAYQSKLIVFLLDIKNPEKFVSLEIGRFMKSIFRVQKVSAKYLLKERRKPKENSFYALQDENIPKEKEKALMKGFKVHCLLQLNLGVIVSLYVETLPKEYQKEFLQHFNKMQDKILTLNCQKNSTQRIEDKRFLNNTKVMKELDLFLIPQTLFYLNILICVSTIFGDELNDFFLKIQEKLVFLCSQPDCKMIRNTGIKVFGNFIQNSSIINLKVDTKKLFITLGANIKGKFKKTWIDEQINQENYFNIETYKLLSNKFFKGTVEGLQLEQMLKDSNFYKLEQYAVEKEYADNPEKKLHQLKRTLQTVQNLDEQGFRRFKQQQIEDLQEYGEPNSIIHQVAMQSKDTYIKNLKREIEFQQPLVWNKFKRNKKK